MNGTRRGRWWAGAAILGAILAPSPSSAGGGKGGHGGGGHAAPHPRAAFHAPSVPRGAFRAPKMPSRPSMPKMAAPRRSAPKPVTMRAPKPAAKGKAPAKAVTAARPKTPRPAARSAVARARPAVSPSGRRISGYRGRVYHHRYVHRGGIRRFRGYGYSRRYVASGRSSMAVVGRLRSVYWDLSRVNQPYGGHRARAMRSLSRAIRQLSHNGGYRRGGWGRGRNAVIPAAAAGGVALAPAQSDAVMRRSLTTLQGARVHLTRFGGGPNHYAASRSIGSAVREISLGLRG